MRHLNFSFIDSVNLKEPIHRKPALVAQNIKNNLVKALLGCVEHVGMRNVTRFSEREGARMYSTMKHGINMSDQGKLKNNINFVELKK